VVEALVSEFSYHATKDGSVLIDWRGRTVTTLRGQEARRFLRRAETEDEQALMQRATGNFKRGNER
jgi:hypothetical protein